jgi:hypothetical protein
MPPNIDLSGQEFVNQ